jgi:hypothetical protein
MCARKELKLGLLLPFIVVGVLVMMNYPELRRYLRIERM